jgi:hypothetical protein
MRVLALLFVLLALPALAGDYTAWPNSDELAQAAPAKTPGQSVQPGQAPSEGGSGGSKPIPSLSGGDYPGRYCCFHCRPNEIPCGGECIPAKFQGQPATCKKPAGCACPGKP